MTNPTVFVERYLDWRNASRRALHFQFPVYPCFRRLENMGRPEDYPEIITNAAALTIPPFVLEPDLTDAW